MKGVDVGSRKPKLLLLLTVPDSLIFFKNQLQSLSGTFDITVSCPQDDTVSNFIEREGVSFIPLSINRRLSPFQDLLTVYSICKLIQLVRPDVLHVNTPKASLLGLIAGFLMRVKVRLYVCHGFAHHPKQSSLAQYFLKSLERFRCCLSTHVVAVSSCLRDELSELCGSKKIDLIHNGSINGIERVGNDYDLTCAPTYDPSINPNEPFKLLFVGRVTKDKGIDELLSSFRELEADGCNVYLQIVGKVEDADYIDEIKQMARQYPTRFEYLGFLDNPLAIMSKNHLLVFPSYREGFGMVVIEAASVNLPSLAFRNLGSTSIIEPGVNGFLTSEHSATELTVTIRNFIQNPSELNKVKDKLADLASHYEQRHVIAETTKYLTRSLND